MGVQNIDGETNFSSRARVAFGMSGETDGGLSFGASFRADNADGANDGDAGSVFISGAFGKLSMGDEDGAAQQATGHVAGVGYTGNGDLNESTFIGAGDAATDPTAVYAYTAGAFTGMLSVTNPVPGVDTTYALGAKYATDMYSVGVGFEDNGAITHTVIKGTVTVSGVTLQALYGATDTDLSQYAVSAGYTMDALGLTAFYADDSELGGVEAYGVGASYDLGGGAAVAGGVTQDQTNDLVRYEAGVTFSF